MIAASSLFGLIYTVFLIKSYGYRYSINIQLCCLLDLFNLYTFSNFSHLLTLHSLLYSLGSSGGSSVHHPFVSFSFSSSSLCTQVIVKQLAPNIFQNPFLIVHNYNSSLADWFWAAKITPWVFKHSALIEEFRVNSLHKCLTYINSGQWTPLKTLWGPTLTLWYTNITPVQADTDKWTLDHHLVDSLLANSPCLHFLAQEFWPVLAPSPLQTKSPLNSRQPCSRT